MRKIHSHGARSIDVAVVGLDRNALAEHARRRFSDCIDAVPIQVHNVQLDAAAILASIDSPRGSTLLLIYRPENCVLQRELFERSTMRTIWVRGDPRPKDDPGRIISAIADHDITTVASERNLTATPTGCLFENLEANDDQMVAVMRAAMAANGLHSNDLIVSGADEFGETILVIKRVWRCFSSRAMRRLD